MDAKEAEAELQGQADIWKYMSFADSMALKCAVELRIADIINLHGGPMTLSQIVARIPNTDDALSLNFSYLTRIMRLLVRRKIYSAHQTSEGDEETMYGLTSSSKWLLHDFKMNRAPMVLLEAHPLLVGPWHTLSQCVKDGGLAFEKVNGREIWDFASESPGFNKLFNDGMACTARITMNAILCEYKDGFGSVRSLVDVGGGTGSGLAEIVESFPHIKCINFDLPHVVATTPIYDGITYVGGGMFQAIPNADAVFMKWIMHDWSDEICVKILKNFRKVISKETGKVIIIDVVLEPEGNDLFDDTGLTFDLVMIAHTSGKD
ncbi:hypothetical protein SO802_015659 [Lithocarpus litseifolius]|uniref:Uncharacterized protein n=1 Tax=Lithocarpus litseifolius TaxID=425828 RepID=A0AAW2CUA3_9ROSI